VVYNGEQSIKRLIVSIEFYVATRYFDDSVRDDYAAGQLDAQVCMLFSRPVFSDH